MSIDDAPPDFWRWPDAASAAIDGVELESSVPTRFFQSVDAYPPEWGRLVWRVQLNRLDLRDVTLPVYRTFYPGVEWNLRAGDGRWFLTAWMRWEGPGPLQPIAQPPAIDGDTVSFCIDRTIFLRCRVDARDRRSIAQNVRSQRADPQPHEPGLISLDDIIGSSH